MNSAQQIIIFRYFFYTPFTSIIIALPSTNTNSSSFPYSFESQKNIIIQHSLNNVCPLSMKRSLFECPLVQRAANPLLLRLLLTFWSLAAFLYEHILRLFLPTRPTNGDTNSRAVYFYTDGLTKIEPEEDVPTNPRQTRTRPPHSRSE